MLFDSMLLEFVSLLENNHYFVIILFLSSQC